MGFKSKFQLGDFVKLNQKGIDRKGYRWGYPANPRIIAVSPYSEGNRTRYEYGIELTNLFNGMKTTFYFKSWELDHASAPCVANIEELI